MPTTNKCCKFCDWVKDVMAFPELDVICSHPDQGCVSRENYEVDNNKCPFFKKQKKKR